MVMPKYLNTVIVSHYLMFTIVKQNRFMAVHFDFYVSIICKEVSTLNV